MIKRIIRLVLLLLGICVLACATLLVVLRWDSIPAEVPTNYTAAGRPDSYAPKGSLRTMLGFGWAAFALMSAIARMPALWKKNGGFVRVSSLRVGGRTVLEPNWLSLDLLSLELALLFSYLAVCSALCRPLGAWLLPAFLGVMLLSFVVPSVLMKNFA